MRNFTDVTLTTVFPVAGQVEFRLKLPGENLVCFLTEEQAIELRDTLTDQLDRFNRNPRPCWDWGWSGIGQVVCATEES